MALDNLRAFIGAIDAAGDLRRVSRGVSARLEITEIADRVMKSPGGGPALLFELPALDLGVQRLDEVGERIAELLNLKVPEGLLAKLAMLPRLAELAKFPPRSVSGKPPCQEGVIRGAEGDLSRFRSEE